MLVSLNVDGVEHIEAPMTSIHLNAKLRIENNGVIVKKIDSSSQILSIPGSSESKPRLATTLSKAILFFWANNKEYSEG